MWEAMPAVAAVLYLGLPCGYLAQARKEEMGERQRRTTRLPAKKRPAQGGPNYCFSRTGKERNRPIDGTEILNLPSFCAARAAGRQRDISRILRK